MTLETEATVALTAVGALTAPLLEAAGAVTLRGIFSAVETHAIQNSSNNFCDGRESVL